MPTTAFAALTREPALPLRLVCGLDFPFDLPRRSVRLALFPGLIFFPFRAFAETHNAFDA
jgi:hypothetical protein